MGEGAGVDILAVGQNFGNVEGNFARGAAGPFTLNDCVHRKRFFCFTRMDEFDNSNFGGNFPGYVIA